MPPPERTPEERERARLEREAKRAAREGRPLPQAPPPTEVPPPESGAPGEGPPRRPEAPAPAAAVDPLRKLPRPRSSKPSRPAMAKPSRPTMPKLSRPAMPKLSRPAMPKLSRPAMPRPPRLTIPRLPRRAPKPPPADTPGPPDVDPGAQRWSRLPPARRRQAVVLPLLAVAIVMVALAWFLLSLFQPFAGEGEGTVAVTIPAGAGVGQIADLLERKGVVSNSLFFRARATLSGDSDNFKAGRFDLKQGMSYAAAIDAIAEAPPGDSVTVTIPEGRARSEVQPIVERSLEGDYRALTRRSRALDPSDYGARRARSLEGFLFPSTYELKRGETAGGLVRRQLQTFEREIAKVDLRFAKRRSLTRYDVLTIASMVEREAQRERERPLIASVIYNRLREGIPLGIDSTIRFATNNWTEPLKVSELELDSPYNTRERQGLPPGPIGSPGLAALKAAARPARTDFLYFVVKPNTCGEHDFSETDAEHERKVDRYERERAKRGGKSPTDC